MINLNCIKADVKQIIREPILIIFVFIPVYIFVLIKLGILYLAPYLLHTTGFDLSNYHTYILAASLIMIPNMLGTVFGFLMLDERDGHITELMVITPIGYNGYIFNRLLLPMLGCFIYTFLGYIFLSITYVPTLQLCLLAFLLSIESLLIGITLFNIADNKVKGLTLAKALSLLALFALADLVNEPVVSLVASFFPFYWITQVIQNPLWEAGSIFNSIMAILIHVCWLLIYFKIINNRSTI
ncbi:hypothetical protein [Vallitalea okinawensis]|uniref:hypothetical protein n=1 Tax=Vallitalea okinawensis TaxID=2078660 RepID=UPI000CFC78A5|nr:hypothetical protein [Vallitalea okinawensis]